MVVNGRELGSNEWGFWFVQWFNKSFAFEIKVQHENDSLKTNVFPVEIETIGEPLFVIPELNIVTSEPAPINRGSNDKLSFINKNVLKILSFNF